LRAAPETTKRPSESGPRPAGRVIDCRPRSQSPRRFDDGYCRHLSGTQVSSRGAFWTTAGALGDGVSLSPRLLVPPSVISTAARRRRSGRSGGDGKRGGARLSDRPVQGVRAGAFSPPVPRHRLHGHSGAANDRDHLADGPFIDEVFAPLHSEGHPHGQFRPVDLPRDWQNCTHVHTKYRHGVGRDWLFEPRYGQQHGLCGTSARGTEVPARC